MKPKIASRAIGCDRIPNVSDDSTFIEDAEASFALENKSLEGESIGQGRYKLGQVVGKGGFGRVYRAEELKTGKTWAVKELAFEGSKAVLETLDKEQKILSWLDHPAIVTRKEAFSERGRVFLIMEYIEGANLRDRFEESELSMPEKGVVELALQITEALVYLHSQKPYPIIFSDLKPSNLMLTDQGQVKLVDFGIARIKSPDSERTLAMGTRGYAAPEQYGKNPIDGRADIYALGVVMHQLLSKLEPREYREKLPPVEHYATATEAKLAQLIGQATEIDPEQRFSTAQSLKVRLEALLKTWSLERKDARRILVHWAGLATRDVRLVHAIQDSVHEVQSARAGRATPWAQSWTSDRRFLPAVNGAMALMLAAVLLADGPDIMDLAIVILIAAGIFVWKMKT